MTAKVKKEENDDNDDYDKPIDQRNSKIKLEFVTCT